MGIVLAAAFKTYNGILFCNAGNGSSALSVHQSSCGLQRVWSTSMWPDPGLLNRSMHHYLEPGEATEQVKHHCIISLF